MKIIELMDDLEGQYCNRNCLSCISHIPIDSWAFLTIWVLNEKGVKKCAFFS